MIAVLLEELPILLVIFAGVFGYAEFSAYCVGRISSRASAVIGIVVMMMLVVALFEMSYAPQTQPLAYFLVMVWIVAVPLGIVGLVSRLLTRADPPIWTHVGLVVVSVLATGIWPIFSLWSICTIGVGCDL